MVTIILLLCAAYGLFLTIASVRAKDAYGAAVEGVMTGAAIAMVIFA